MGRLEDARLHLDYAGYTNWVYCGIIGMFTFCVLGAFCRTTCSNSICTIELVCTMQTTSEAVAGATALVFSALAISRYYIGIAAIVDLAEITNGCMDDYTTIPDVVIENVLIDTAETGRKWGMSCLTFASIIMIKVSIVGFILYKHWKKGNRPIKKEISM